MLVPRARKFGRGEFFALFTSLALIGAGGCERPSPGAAPKSEVNVYSSRHYDADLTLYDAFARETGIRVNLIEADGDALIERLGHEGEASPADIFLTADAGMLWRAQNRGLFRPISDQEILARVAARLRGPDGLWVALSKRARVIIYNKNQGLPEGLMTYEDLARPDFRGMICIRSSSSVYNQSLLASIIAHDGPEAGERWAKGVAANFARKPQGTDTSQIEAVAAGLCRLGVVNSYYVARYTGARDRKMRQIGDRIGVLFPNQKTTGAHVNISGAGVLKHAPHPENAEALIKFLLRDDSQAAFAEANNEYPAVESVEARGPIVALGEFRGDDLDTAALGRYQPEALKTFDRAGWP